MINEAQPNWDFSLDGAPDMPAKPTPQHHQVKRMVSSGHARAAEASCMGLRDCFSGRRLAIPGSQSLASLFG